MPNVAQHLFGVKVISVTSHSHTAPLFLPHYQLLAVGQKDGVNTAKALPDSQKEMTEALGFCGVVLLQRVTVKIAFCKCKLQILNNFLIGHGAKAANGGKKQVFF